MFKPETSFIILKILIQNEITGNDPKRSIFLKVMDPKLNIETCRGEDDACIAPTPLF